MIKIIDGDLITSNTDIIAHQVNCKGAFNSGVAKAIRDYDVQVYKDYHSFCSINTPEQLLGSVRYFQPNIDARIYANLFAQKSYGYDGKQYTDIDALRKCFENLKSYAVLENMSIAMPYKIGCVRGGANWEKVHQMIENIFYDCNVELWRLDKG